MSVFASRLREVRGSKSQAEFAKLLGVKTAAYGHYETGRTQPSVDVIIRIVEVSGRSSDWLFGISKENNHKINRADQKLEALKKAITEILKEY